METQELESDIHISSNSHYCSEMFFTAFLRWPYTDWSYYSFPLRHKGEAESMTTGNKGTTAGPVKQADRKLPLSKTNGSREGASLMPLRGGSQWPTGLRASFLLWAGSAAAALGGAGTTLHLGWEVPRNKVSWMSILLNINLFKLVRSLHNIEKHTQHCVGCRFLYFFFNF